MRSTISVEQTRNLCLLILSQRILGDSGAHCAQTFGPSVMQPFRDATYLSPRFTGGNMAQDERARLSRRELRLKKD